MIDGFIVILFSLFFEMMLYLKKSK